MINRVIFIGDVYRGDQAQNIERLSRLFAPVLKQLSVPISTYISETNRSDDMSVWLREWERSLDATENSELEALDVEGALIIGFEASSRDLKYLTTQDVPWVNFAIHPLRFLDDLYFDVATSFPYDMATNVAEVGMIDLCVQALRGRYSSRTNAKANGVKTLAIFGQTPIDRSVYFDQRFLGLDAYFSKIDELTEKYDRIIYKPHPNLSNPGIDKLIRERYRVELISNLDVYELFITENIETACSISSSVLTEAPYFGIAPIFLEPRARRYGPPVSYRRLLDDLNFWNMALFGKKSCELSHMSQVVPANYLRRTWESWGYVTDDKLLEGRIIKAQNECIQPVLDDLRERLRQEEAHAEQIETRVGEAVAGIQQAEAHATQAESRAAQAEARAAQAEGRAAQAEGRAAQAEAYVTQVDAHRQQAEARAIHAEAKTVQAEARAVHAEAQAAQAEARAVYAEAQAVQAKAHATQIEADATRAWAEWRAVVNSRSWRVTAPLRWLLFQARLMRRDGPTSRVIALFKKVERGNAEARRPWSITAPFRWVFFQIGLLRRDGFKSRARALAKKLRRGAPNSASSVGNVNSATGGGLASNANSVVKHQSPGKLTPHAQRIYTKLQRAIQKNNLNNNGENIDAHSR